MDDIEINNVLDLIKVLNKYKAGDRVSMEFFRGPGKIKLKTVLEKGFNCASQTITSLGKPILT